MENQNFWILVGTRPEVIKQVPLYFELVRRHGKDRVSLIGTGQHRELLDQALSHFGVRLDHNLEIMKPGQSLTDSSAQVLLGMNDLFQYHKPDWLIVQGDTTSAAMAAWAAFQSGVPVAHNEAGLRSYDLENPFPEEANRRLISIVAKIHFAPTELAKKALLKEGIDEKSVFVTGNTGIDALKWTLDQPRPRSIDFVMNSIRNQGLRPVLLTAHRRENSGSMDGWFKALGEFLSVNPGYGLIYPLHPNHLARPAAEKHLRHLPQVHLVPALNYGETCHLLSACDLVVTDSGGIQEEAATLGIPTVICRKTTERMEAVEYGIARLAGTETDTILSVMNWAMNFAGKGSPHHPDSFPNSIFGNGQASVKIADLLQ